MTVFQNSEKDLNVWNDREFRNIVWGLLIGSLLSFTVAQIVNIYRYVEWVIS